MLESIEVTHYIYNIERGLSNLDSHWQGCLDSLQLWGLCFYIEPRSIIVKCDLDDKSSKYFILLVQAPQTSDLTHSCVSAVSYIISSAMERNQGQNIAVEILIIDKVLHTAQHDI